MSAAEENRTEDEVPTVGRDVARQRAGYAVALREFDVRLRPRRWCTSSSLVSGVAS